MGYDAAAWLAGIAALILFFAAVIAIDEVKGKEGLKGRIHIIAGVGCMFAVLISITFGVMYNRIPDRCDTFLFKENNTTIEICGKKTPNQKEKEARGIWNDHYAPTPTPVVIVVED